MAKKKSEKIVPISKVHFYDLDPGEQTYGACFAHDNSTFCDASIDDLRSLKALMERDPRLMRIADLDTVVTYIDQNCFGVNYSNRKQDITTWPKHQLRRCNDEQPVLITHAIGIRLPLFKNDGSERAAEWRRECNQTYGSSFIDQHCDALALQKERRKIKENRTRNGQFTPLDSLHAAAYPESAITQYGFETYFCPDAL